MRVPGLGSWIERRAARTPAAPALVIGERAWTYAELAREVRGATSMLRALGVAPGDRVAYHGRNDVAALTSLFGATALGAVWVPVHPGRPEDEVRAVIDDTEPCLVVRSAPATHPDLGIAEVEGEHLEAASDEPLVLHDPDPDDLAILAPTSGTTGRPKSVMLTHANLTWNVVNMLVACAFAPVDVILAAAPFTRMGGLGVSVLPALFTGGCVVVPAAVDGDVVLTTIARRSVTVLFANPDLLTSMVDAPSWGAADLSSVRTGVVGGGLVPEPLLRAYLDRGVPLRHGYGLTEAGPAVSLLDERDAATMTSSVGKPLAFVDLRVVRPDGSRCDVDEVGEWEVRGPNVSAGYWRLPSPLRDGWFPTGDVGCVDADGYLTLLDRRSSAIDVDGVTVYPATIERALFELTGVVDAAVVQAGGRLVAAVVASGSFDLEACRDALRSALAPHELPDAVVTVETIPRNASGKVRRDELRASLER